MSAHRPLGHWLVLAAIGALVLLLTGLANLAVAFVYAGIGAAAMSTNSGGLAMLGAVIMQLCAWLTYRWWLGRPS